MNLEGFPTPIPPSTQVESSGDQSGADEAETLNTLARKLFHAKQAEANAKKVRIEAEEAIGNLVAISGDSGSRTVDAGDGLKLTVKRSMNYKADVDAIRELGMAEGVCPVMLVPATYAFDKKAYENIRENHPDLASQLAGCITATPAKIAVTLKMG